MRRALKGLSHLIAEETETAPSEALLQDIQPNRSQPRSVFDEHSLHELAASIRVHGVLQPLAVRARGGGKYELIAGERRYRAAKLAGLKSVPIVLREADNRESLEIALVENIQREDITPMECARAYRRLMDEFGLTQEQVAEKVGKGRTSVANSVRLLKLPARIQQGLEAGDLSEGHARALLALSNDAQMLAVYDQILKKGLTVREVERITQEEPAKKSKGAPRHRVLRSVEDASLEDALSTHLGTPVRLSRSPEGGQIAITFYSEDDLQRILELLGVNL